MRQIFELSLIIKQLPGSGVVDCADDAFLVCGLRVDGVSKLVDTAGLLSEGNGTSEDCNCAVVTAVALDVFSANSTETFIAGRSRVKTDAEATAEAVVVILTLCVGDF